MQTDDLTGGLEFTTEDAERAVLGAMLRDAGAINDACLILTAEHFRSPRHRMAFAAIVHLYDGGTNPDPVTVAQELRRRGQHQDATPTHLAELWDAAPTTANVTHHARLVREAALLHALHHAGRQIAHEALNPTGPADEVLDAAEREIMRIAESGVTSAAVPLRQALSEAMRRIDERVERRKQNLPAAAASTGLIDLDKLLGGLYPSELVVLGARPSVGKTSLALALSQNVALGGPVFFASLEQSRSELAERLLASLAQVDAQLLRTGKIDSLERVLADAVSSLEPLPLWIDDTPGQTALRIAAGARRLKRRHGLRLIVVDYLQLVTADGRHENRNCEVAYVSRRLKALAKELDCPVLALAQLNRETERRSGDGRPKLSDLRDSGSIEADADTVLLLHRPVENGVLLENVLDVIVAKQRNGPTGDVRLTFRRDLVRFDNHADGSPP